MVSPGAWVDFHHVTEGFVHIAVVGLILRVLQARFPVHTGVRVLRIGLFLLKFVPRRGERTDEWFQRFDVMIEAANGVANFVVNKALAFSASAP